MLHERLGQLPAHRVVRRQGRQRVLEDHRHLVAAELLQLLLGGGDEFLAVEDDLAVDGGGARVVQAQDRQVGDGLPGAGLAHDAQGLAALDVEGEAVDRLDDAVLGGELHPQVTDREEALGPGRGRGVLGLGQCGHGGSFFLGEPDARVDVGVRDVGEDVHDQDEEGTEQHDAHRQRQVLGLGAVHGQAADALEGEGELRDHGTAEHAR